MDLLERFRSVLKPGGLLIVTTPAGRWEWQGTEAFREAREHLHHFERQDIVEICGANPVQILYAPYGSDRAGKSLGSWIWGVRAQEPFRDYDVERKRKLLAPRETLSACMIVKDGEKTLRKCIESFIDWVDEIIIAIDPGTKDRTCDVIGQLREDFKWKPITMINGLPALEEGFDAARNRSIEAACGDWILWVDADEEVRNPFNLWKYLRPSQHKAYGFPQVHYSADPDQVLTTDYPCRLFRNRAGIKFFGVVHEHPEIEVGKAIPRSALRQDVKFLHNGYVDEEVRRKRYMRNLPLLHRDLQKYPERGLNRFLWLRDIAQGLMFEHEQTQGVILHGHRERAQEGVEMWRAMVEKDPLRMVMDSLQFYSHCVGTLGEGFDAEVTYRVAKECAPDLACNTNFKGRFASQDDYSKLIRKIEQEATRHYDSKYL
jgi:glycosyltransferase involved in cell wall biosynthesis